MDFKPEPVPSMNHLARILEPASAAGCSLHVSCTRRSPRQTVRTSEARQSRARSLHRRGTPSQPEPEPEPVPFTVSIPRRESPCPNSRSPLLPRAAHFMSLAPGRSPRQALRTSEARQSRARSFHRRGTPSVSPSPIPLGPYGTSATCAEVPSRPSGALVPPAACPPTPLPPADPGVSVTVPPCTGAVPLCAIA
jgi:hypothetical protein